MSSTSGTRLNRSAANRFPIAASKSGVPSATSSAAPAVDDVGTNRAPGRFSNSHRRHCASPWGWEPTATIESSGTSSRAIRVNRTGTATSPVMRSAGGALNSSKVPETEPSTEFSMGTTAASTSPLRTRSRAAITDAAG